MNIDKFKELLSVPSKTYQEEEDNYLQLQALAAARTIHDVKGMDYDEKNEIDILSDIKFVVVAVSLPLGCEYQHFCSLFLLSFSSRITNGNHGRILEISHSVFPRT